MNEPNLLNTYFYKNKDAKNTWYKFDPEKQKEVEVERPTISDKFQKELELIRDFFYNLKFWKEDNFASIIKIVCNIDEEDVEFIEAKKNQLCSFSYDTQWYTYLVQTKFFMQSFKSEYNDKEPLQLNLEDYENYKDQELDK